VITNDILRFLEQAHAAEIRHSGRSLLEHLVGTHNLLQHWGNPQDLCLAGLFHSVYGTDRFTHSMVQSDTDNRQQVRELIGTRAEQLAFLFCSFRREELFTLGADKVLTAGAATLVGASDDHHALQEIEVANFLEQRLYLIANGQHPRAHGRIRKNMPHWQGYLLPPPSRLSPRADSHLRQFFQAAAVIASRPPEGNIDAPLRRHQAQVQLPGAPSR
jgi:hypothetical protein